MYMYVHWSLVNTSVSSRTEFKQGGGVLTLLSLNIIMGYYIGHEEGMICFAGLCNVH